MSGLPPGKAAGLGAGDRAGQSVTGSVVVGDVIQLANVSGSVGVTLTRPLYRVEGLAAVRGGLSVDRARAQPSLLLSARYEVVPFTGRVNLLQELADWLCEETSPVSVRLVYGPGGQGKSRLAAQFARQHGRGWAVWQARQAPPSSDAPRRIDIPDGVDGLLVIVDYAERWALSHLQALIRDLSALAGHLPDVASLRVLMLARSSGFWWSALEGWLDSDCDIPAAALSLPPLGSEVNRDAMFASARDRFADAMQVSGCHVVGSPNGLSEPAFGQVLTVHMAALAAVDAHYHGASAPGDPARISAYLLKRERGHWQQWHARAEDALGTPPQALGRTVYLATLAGPLAHASGIEALERVQIASLVENANQILADHQQCYPPEDPATVLEPLYPDRLGEDFLALTTPGHATGETSAGMADAWASTAISRLLGPLPGEELAHAWTRSAITVLIETARRWPHIASGQLYPLLRDYPQLALQAGGTSLAALAALDDIDPALLEAIESHFPHHRHVDLDIGMAAVTERLAKHPFADPAKQAHLYHNFARRLSWVGLYQRAVIATQDALSIYRRLALDNPAYRSGVAEELRSLGNDYSDMGWRDEALTATQEALFIYRGLAQANPTAFEPDLAMTLVGLGNRLAQVGRREEALTVAWDAVSVYRRLVHSEPATYGPELAASLTNLGSRLSAIGRLEEALTVAHDAVSEYRRIVEVNAAAYEPELAASLINLSSELTKARRHQEALAAIEDAIGILQRLAQVNPGAHEGSLAASLSSLGYQLSEIGRRREGLAAFQHAAEIQRRLVRDNPSAYESSLCSTLSKLAFWLSHAERPEEALAAARDAVMLRKMLTREYQATLDPDLNNSLIHLALALMLLDQNEEGLTVLEDAVAVSRRLAQASPAIYESDLAHSLRSLGDGLTMLGRREKALTATEEAVAVYRRLAQANPAIYQPDFAGSLSSLAGKLSEAGRNEKALVAVKDAVEIWQQLAQASNAHEADLAGALTDLADRLGKVSQSEEAVAPARRAVEIWQRLAQANPAAYEQGLAKSLCTLGPALILLSQWDEALSVTQESATIHQRLVQAGLDAHLPDLAARVSDLAVSLSLFADLREKLRTQLGDAFAAISHAVLLYRLRAERSPEYLIPLKNAIKVATNILAALGRSDDAMFLAQLIEMGEIVEAAQLIERISVS